MPSNSDPGPVADRAPTLRDAQTSQRGNSRSEKRGSGGGASPGRIRRGGPERLSIPAAAQRLSPYDFPMSTRLTNVLLKQGIKHLGQLDGMTVSHLKELKSCGWKTAAELVRLTNRISAGEFELAAPDISAQSVAELLATAEKLIGDLPAREREMVLLRIGAGKDQKVWTLRRIGNRYHVTRERVRQIAEKTFAQVRAGGGPAVAGLLEGMASSCAQRACPLTVPLLAQWLEGAKTPRRYPLACYVRVLSGLEPKIPAWPQGQGPTGTQEGRAKTIINALEGVLQAQARPLAAHKAFELTRSQANLRGLTVPEFLAAVKTARRVLFEFPKPDQPKVSLRGKQP